MSEPTQDVSVVRGVAWRMGPVPISLLPLLIPHLFVAVVGGWKVGSARSAFLAVPSTAGLNFLVLACTDLGSLTLGSLLAGATASIPLLMTPLLIAFADVAGLFALSL